MKSITQPSFMKGIMFTFMIAMISYILAKFPILHTIGALAIAIIFAMLYRQVMDIQNTFVQVLRSHRNVY